MRRIPRATTTRNSSIRVVLVDALKQQMIDLKALRKKVTEAERLAAPNAHRPLSIAPTPGGSGPFRAPRG